MDCMSQQGKDVIAPQIIYTCNIVLFIYPAQLSVDINKISTKFVWKNKGAIIAKTIFKTENKMERDGLPYLKSY